MLPRSAEVTSEGHCGSPTLLEASPGHCNSAPFFQESIPGPSPNTVAYAWIVIGCSVQNIVRVNVAAILYRAPAETESIMPKKVKKNRHATEPINTGFLTTNQLLMEDTEALLRHFYMGRSTSAKSQKRAGLGIPERNVWPHIASPSRKHEEYWQRTVRRRSCMVQIGVWRFSVRNCVPPEIPRSRCARSWEEIDSSGVLGTQF